MVTAATLHLRRGIKYTESEPYFISRDQNSKGKIQQLLKPYDKTLFYSTISPLYWNVFVSYSDDAVLRFAAYAIRFRDPIFGCVKLHFIIFSWICEQTKRHRNRKSAIWKEKWTLWNCRNWNWEQMMMMMRMMTAQRGNTKNGIKWCWIAKRFYNFEWDSNKNPESICTSICIYILKSFASFSSSFSSRFSVNVSNMYVLDIKYPMYTCG